MKALLSVVPAGIVASIVALKELMGKERTVSPPPTTQPPAPKEEGTPVLVPFIRRPTYEVAYGGGYVPQMPQYNTVNVVQPVRVIPVNPKDILPVDGVTEDDYTDENTYEFTDAWDRFDLLSEGGDVSISLRTLTGEWTEDIPFPEGFSSIDFKFTGIRLRSRNPGTSVNYYLNLYRW